MAEIRPISDLRNKAFEIYELCHEGNEPVFITRNGRSDMVVMSKAHYDQLQARIELYQKLAEAEAEDAVGAQGIDHNTLMKTLRKRFA